MVLFVNGGLRVCLAVCEWDPLELQRQLGWRADLAGVAHSHLPKSKAALTLPLLPY
jgi:hypothetical protein